MHVCTYSTVCGNWCTFVVHKYHGSQLILQLKEPVWLGLLYAVNWVSLTDCIVSGLERKGVTAAAVQCKLRPGKAEVERITRVIYRMCRAISRRQHQCLLHNTDCQSQNLGDCQTKEVSSLLIWCTIMYFYSFSDHFLLWKLAAQKQVKSLLNVQ